MLKKLRNSSLVLVSLLIVSGCVNQNQKIASTDKIVATSVTITEILDALKVDASKVIGIPSTTSYTIPDRYKGITSIGGAMAPDMEIITKLSPSLILSPNSLESDLSKKYKKASFNSAFLNLKSVAGMYKSIEELGTLLHHEEQANKLINEFVSYMKTYQAAHNEKTKHNVLILMGLPGSYVVATSSSYVGNLVELAGGSNVYGDGDGTDFINVNPEDMLKKNPDIILRTSHAMPEQVKEMFAKEFSENEIWTQFTAVKNKKVYDLSNQNFGMSANFNYQKALKELDEILYAKD